MADDRLLETVTLSQAKTLIKAMAARQSLLLLSPPGVGKSDVVRQAAAEAGLPCRSLLGTQIAPEDVSGVPRIVGERSVFCPPRVLLPETPEPFCLFLDELPACTPDIQKAFYALLLERRLGEYPLPPGTWVVAAGNRATDRALVRSISSALVNRVVILHVRVDFAEWLVWAHANHVRDEVIRFLTLMPEALDREVPDEAVPFSTPRSWASLGQALDRAEAAGVLNGPLRRALAFGRVSAPDAAAFCALAERGEPVGTFGPAPAVPDLSLEDLNLSVRATNCLESEGITRLRELVARTDDELLEVRNFNETCLREVKAKLTALGLTTGMGSSGAPRSDADFVREAARQHGRSPANAEVTLGQAKALIRSLAGDQSLLLLSPPGVGKSDIVRQAAVEAGLPCRSLLGTQIAPEDVSGVPRIVGERSVFCPPRVLLPDDPAPFCLFLDELPACTPDIQKAFYALLLERRVGEHALPPGTWVVAAGNRAADRALVRALSSALVNRVFLIHIRVDAAEWRTWAEANGIRRDVIEFIAAMPEALMRPVPDAPVPFSTPRAWASLSGALDRAEMAGILTDAMRRALAQGRVSGMDAAAYCAMIEEHLLPPPLSPVVPPDIDLAELDGLSGVALKHLRAAGINRVPELAASTEEELLALPQIGAATVAKLRTALDALGLALRKKGPLTVASAELRTALLPYSRPPAPGEALTLGQAKALINALADAQSLLLLSAPGVGKSDIVRQAAAEAGLECRSLLGTQIAPEDVSGVPRIVGERSVFCPPRVLLPENPEPFCLFLDELPACSPDIQKAFYALLLERRLGEYPLPPGTWVVAAGNRAADRALVRSISSALVNRVFIVQVKVDVKEWLVWAQRAGVRAEVRGFVGFMPETLMRPVPNEPVPFSTPRAWASLAEALSMAEDAGVLDATLRRAIAFGRVTGEDAAIFCTMAEEQITGLRPTLDYLHDPKLLPNDDTSRWFIFCRVRNLLQRGELRGLGADVINNFLLAVPVEHRFALTVDLVEQWGALGADASLLRTALEFIGQ